LNKSVYKVRPTGLIRTFSSKVETTNFCLLFYTRLLSATKLGPFICFYKQVGHRLMMQVGLEYLCGASYPITQNIANLFSFLQFTIFLISIFLSITTSIHTLIWLIVNNYFEWQKYLLRICTQNYRLGQIRFINSFLYVKA